MGNQSKPDIAKLDRGTLFCQVRSVPDKDRVYRFIGTTAIRDRMGDEIPLDGWQFDNYLRNPVVLWAHRYDLPPVGRTLQIKKGKTPDGNYGWVFEVEFAPEDANPFAEQIRKLVDGGFLNAVSVGFQSLKSKPIEESEEELEKRLEENPDLRPGLKFEKKELWELSICPVPANPQALRKAISNGQVEVPREVELAMAHLDLIQSYEALHTTARIKKQLEEQGKKSEAQEKKEEEAPAPKSEEDPYEGVEIKGAIPYSVHGDGPKAPEDTPWNAGEELKKATGDAKKLRRMHAWVNSSADGFDPAERQWYKLPHHKGDGAQPVVWRGVAAAMARLMQGKTDIPEKDRKGVYNHLAQHYKQFGKEPPEFKEAPEVVTKPGWEDSESWTEIKYRVRDPDEFEKDSFRRITLKKSKPRVFAVIGRPKGQNTTKIQSLRFPKDDGWTIDKAKKWVKDHPDLLKFIDDIWVELIEAFAPERKAESAPQGENERQKQEQGQGKSPLRFRIVADDPPSDERNEEMTIRIKMEGDNDHEQDD